MVLTASSAYVKYGYELNYGFGATDSVIFGKDQKLSGLKWMTNQQEITQLHTPEVQDFVYGKNEGTCGIDYTLSNPWAFTSVFNKRIKIPIDDVDPDTTGDQPIPDNQYWTSDPRVNPLIRRIPSMNLQFGYTGGDGRPTDSPIVRNAKGAVTSTLNIKTGINDKVSVSQSIVWANEDAITTVFAAPALDVDAAFIPFMFHHASLQLPSGTTLAQVQDLDITFDTGAQQWYGIGDEDGVDAHRGLLKMTGKFSMAVIDNFNLGRVRDREVIPNMKIVIGSPQNSTITIDCERIGFGETCP